MKYSGNLGKMHVHLASPVLYDLEFGDQTVRINDLLGQRIRMSFSGVINCVNCGKVTKKAFGEGYCYPCFISAPSNAECVIRPELCEGHLGKGRDPQWELEKHVQPHIVYLALTSGVKVGVTRVANVPDRWIDQGAWKVIRLAETPYRRIAGEIEVFLKDYVTDKTNWQRMLKNEMDTSADLLAEKESLLNELPEELGQYYSENDEILELSYPVRQYPAKVNSLNLDKTPVIEGEVNGLRGQYLMLADGQVLNIRRFSGYLVDFEVL
ncbi:MAG: hypothetical protein RLZZ519_1433 [Bacteroidota bacterium]|jgi:hypothetical protein